MTAAGDAGNNFLMSVFTDEEKVEEFAGGAQKLLAEAKNGDWAISEAGGQAFIEALEQAKQDLTEAAKQLPNLLRSPELGNDPYAREVAGHVLASLDSDDQSLALTFKNFQISLNDMHEAIKIARSNYDAADDESKQSLGPFLKSLES
ncbi:hypothetical protein [Amycolatopsis suaedae]|uniref:Uncharacterized protein n=1 Tax=Amycolatopsis suaedae TaxID=2510978 RepID=A0A4Q7J2C6_9PSEU|nr:hypothetical protein [Amycolatopsis suaedae]RZQ60742.1 hypothetical protein EWH70_26895 [Amycolatopsis suaedae]